eukprot:SM000021S06400  [mRNA]  locus=s21:15045:16629:+ [translate_table: standard]
MAAEEPAPAAAPPGRRFCVLEAGHPSEYTAARYGGYGAMFVDLLADPGESWAVFPYDGFVITGSRHDAHGDEPWILRLCSTLRAVHACRRRVLGVCFGHQVLSRALGGRTGRALGGWNFGLKSIPVSKELRAKPYGASLPPVLRSFVVHQDQVQEVPPGSEILGATAETAVEIFSLGDDVLGFQGHPEFTADVVEDLVQSRLQLGVISEEVAAAARKSMAESQPDTEALRTLCKAFLKGPAPVL